MTENNMVSFDPKKLLRLKKAFVKAVDDGAESFTFDGREWLTMYAKYVIEYLDREFEKQ